MLLDTNALIWMQQDSPKLGKAARRYIENADSLFFSSMSILEIEIKRMKSGIPIPKDFYQDLLDQGFIELKLSGQHAEALRQFTKLVVHDPFDRTLLATAYVEGHLLLTSDSTLLNLGLPFVVDSQQ
jgi:PIN domain nuclease of toxin-antitoxin system